jgi:hypothetical protein
LAVLEVVVLVHIQTQRKQPPEQPIQAAVVVVGQTSRDFSTALQAAPVS